MKTILIPILLLFIFVITSCGGSKKVVNLENLKPLKVNKLAEKLDACAYHPEWLYSKGQIHYKDHRIGIGVTYSAILRKDSIFVMAVKKLGMVVGKIKITPDSIIILNPFQKKWMGGKLADIANIFGVPPKFSVIQDMILGNPMIVTRQNSHSLIENQKYKYTAHDDHWLNHFWIDPLNDRLSKQYLKDNYTKQRIVQEITEYKKMANGTLFSFFRTLELHTIQNGQIDIKIDTKKVIWNQPRAIHFSIPSHYNQVQ